jgi:hypothetical protein
MTLLGIDLLQSVSILGLAWASVLHMRRHKRETAAAPDEERRP